MTDDSSVLAYSLHSFAKSVDLSYSAIRQEIDAGNLIPVYKGSKPLIPRDEGERWLKSLPTERRAS